MVKPRRQFVDEGQNAKFKVSFEGSPNTQLSWSKDGKPLPSGSKFKVGRKRGRGGREKVCVCVCVCVCVLARARARVFDRAIERERGGGGGAERKCVCVCVCVCMRASERWGVCVFGGVGVRRESVCVCVEGGGKRKRDRQADKEHGEKEINQRGGGEWMVVGGNGLA